MKKALAIILAFAMVLGMAISVSAVAVESPAASEGDLKPFLIFGTSEEYAIYTPERVNELPKEAQEIFSEAKEKLAEVIPEDMAARYFFYFQTNEPCSAVFSLDNYLENYEEIVFMQYIDGEWVELESFINAPGTIKVMDENGELIELKLEDVQLKIGEDGTVTILNEDGELIEFEVEDMDIQFAADKTITVLNVADDPIAIFVK